MQYIKYRHHDICIARVCKPCLQLRKEVTWAGPAAGQMKNFHTEHDQFFVVDAHVNVRVRNCMLATLKKRVLLVDRETYTPKHACMRATLTSVRPFHPSMHDVSNKVDFKIHLDYWIVQSIGQEGGHVVDVTIYTLFCFFTCLCPGQRCQRSFRATSLCTRCLIHLAAGIKSGVLASPVHMALLLSNDRERITHLSRHPVQKIILNKTKN